ncbi:MAG: hypothetical protein IIX93_12540, partial [Clostridia bacterium]|nr:hypothetical protein [Clostridia bacterium]
MKRVYILLALLLCAMFAFSAQAIEVEPGQTFTLPISVFSGNKLACAEFTVTYDASTFTMVSCSVDERYMDFDPLDGHYVLLRLRGILDGQVGSVTLRVNAGAKAGTYNLGVIRGMLLDIDENDIDKEVSFGLGGSITVKVDCKHDKTEDKIIKAATCDTAGEKQVVCSDCGEVIKTETIDKLNHKLGAYEVTKPATCTEKGVETAKCERCSYTKTRSIDVLNHKVGEFEVTKPATCTEDGEKTAKCERCSHTVTEVITKLNHKVG